MTYGFSKFDSRVCKQGWEPLHTSPTLALEHPTHALHLGSNKGLFDAVVSRPTALGSPGRAENGFKSDLRGTADWLWTMRVTEVLNDGLKVSQLGWTQMMVKPQSRQGA